MSIDRTHCHDACCQVKVQIKTNKLSPQELYQLSSKGIKFAQKRDQTTGKSIDDQTTIIYNEYIEIKNIPDKVYQWKLNGQSVLKKFINFYRLKKDEANKIENDPNDFIKAHGGAVLVDRIQQIIHISIQTQKLINLLRTIEFNNRDYLCALK